MDSRVPLLSDGPDDEELNKHYPQPPKDPEAVNYIKAFNKKSSTSSKLLLVFAMAVGIASLWLTVYFIVPMAKQWMTSHGQQQDNPYEGCELCVYDGAPHKDVSADSLQKMLLDTDTYNKCYDDCLEVISLSTQMTHEDDSAEAADDSYYDSYFDDYSGELDVNDWPDAYDDYSSTEESSEESKEADDKVLSQESHTDYDEQSEDNDDDNDSDNDTDNDTDNDSDKYDSNYYDYYSDYGKSSELSDESDEVTDVKSGEDNPIDDDLSDSDYDSYEYDFDADLKDWMNMNSEEDVMENRNRNSGDA